jgi:hypothetical protein
MTKRFSTAVDKLIRAFFDGNLKKGECDKCAVGSICDGSKKWSLLFETNPDTLEQDRFGLNQYMYDLDAYEEPLEVIAKTGYSPEELAEVEYAFEANSWHVGDVTSKDDAIQSQFDGLCAVIDKLCEFDEIQNSEFYKDKLREKFVV